MDVRYGESPEDTSEFFPRPQAQKVRPLTEVIAPSVGVEAVAEIVRDVARHVEAMDRFGHEGFNQSKLSF